MKTKCLIILLTVLISFQIKQLKSQTESVGWTQLSFTPSTILYAVYCINYDTVMAVGANGYIVRTTDGGTNWISVPSNTTNSLYSLSFINDSVGYACGMNGTVVKTTNYGQSWTNIGISTDLNFYSLSFINNDTGWVAGGNSIVYMENGTKGILAKTINGGASWIVDSSYNANVTSVLFLDNDTGYIAISRSTYTNRLKKTTNGGITYTIIQQDSALPIYAYGDIHFVNYKTGYFVKSGNNYGIYKTDDYGDSWVNVASDSFPINNTFNIDSCNIYYSWWNDETCPGSGGFAGENICTSKLFDSSDVNVYAGSFYLININYGFGVGEYIYKRDTGIIQNIKECQLAKIKLFPNPFHDKITITLNPEMDITEMNFSIYNSLGQEVLNNYFGDIKDNI